jgi:hypothetical protein
MLFVYKDKDGNSLKCAPFTASSSVYLRSTVLSYFVSLFFIHSTVRSSIFLPFLFNFHSSHLIQFDARCYGSLLTEYE